MYGSTERVCEPRLRSECANRDCGARRLTQLPGTAKALQSWSTRTVSSYMNLENAFESVASRRFCTQPANMVAQLAPCSVIMASSQASFHHVKSFF